MRFTHLLGLLLIVVVSGYTPTLIAQQSDLTLPTESLKFGVFVATFDPGGTFTVSGDRWPTIKGNWKAVRDEIEYMTSSGPSGCDEAGRYRLRTEGKTIS